ncbi:MAG TPA: hypothetical protein VFW68_12470 [Rhodocyclaceae bacterium]|nr:hypothetical protein [Rhodocyclaceae bacterium]
MRETNLQTVVAQEKAEKPTLNASPGLGALAQRQTVAAQFRDGDFGYVDFASGKFVAVGLCPGFARGLTIEAVMTELYDVAFLPGVKRPFTPGFSEPQLHRALVHLPANAAFPSRGILRREARWARQRRAKNRGGIMTPQAPSILLDKCHFACSMAFHEANGG